MSLSSKDQKLPEKELTVKATAFSGDYRISICIDVTPWFKSATDQELMALTECGFGDDQASDRVIQCMAENGCEKARDLLDYLSILNRHGNLSKPMRFESQIDRDSACLWLKTYRADILQELDMPVVL
jgi:hypothetical protein